MPTTKTSAEEGETVLTSGGSWKATVRVIAYKLGISKKKARPSELDGINERFSRTREKRHKLAEANGIKLFGRTHL